MTAARRRDCRRSADPGVCGRHFDRRVSKCLLQTAGGDTTAGRASGRATRGRRPGWAGRAGRRWRVGRAGSSRGGEGAYHDRVDGVVDPAIDADALLDDLDADQRRAVTAESRLVAVIAGAGSGKTRVLTRRIAHRIATGSADARHTLVLTFTREAAGELRRRLHRSGIRERVEAGTFHSVMLGVLQQRWADTDRRPKTVVADRRRLVGDWSTAGARRSLDHFLAEINWAAARGIAARRSTPPPRGARSADPPPASSACAAAFAALRDAQAPPRRRSTSTTCSPHTIRELASTPPTSPTRCAGASATCWSTRRRTSTRCSTGCSTCSAPGATTCSSSVTRRRRSTDSTAPTRRCWSTSRHRFPGVEVIRLPMNHRCTPQIVAAGLHVLGRRASSRRRSRRAAPTARPWSISRRPTRPPRQRRIAQFVAAGDPTLVRTGEIGVLVRTNVQVGPITDALADGRRAGRTAARTRAGSPIQAVVRQVAALGSASQLRAWAHDTLDGTPIRLDAVHASSRHEHRIAARHARVPPRPPLGDGAGFRAWVATTNPFDDGSRRRRRGADVPRAPRDANGTPCCSPGSRRAWCRTGRRAPPRAARRRDGLLYVAMTRATDRLVVTHAARRGGLRPDAEPVHRGPGDRRTRARSPAGATSSSPHRSGCSRSSPTGARTGPANSTCSRPSCAPTATSRRSPAIVRRRRRTRRRHLVRADDRGTHRRTTRPGARSATAVRFARRADAAGRTLDADLDRPSRLGATRSRIDDHRRVVARRFPLAGVAVDDRPRRLVDDRW